MIDFRRLRYLVTLALRLSYSRAAEELGITQSALTRSIQSLEKEVGIRLFDRDQGGVTLTSRGRSVVEQAEILLATVRDFEHQVMQTASGREGRIRFGMTPVVSKILLPAILPQRINAAPSFGHEVLVRETEQLWHLLTSRDLEFFVSAEWQLPEVLPIRAELLGEFPISMIVRDGHPLLSGHQDATGFPFLASTLASITGPMPDDIRAIITDNVNVIEDFSTLSAVTQATDAIWATSTFAIRSELESGLLRKLNWPLEGPPPSSKIIMYSLDRFSQSPPALELKHSFRTHMRQMSRGGIPAET